jgi:RNA polymerase sigma-70 factor (TIGR02960 family)
LRTSNPVTDELERLRPELTRYCYSMLGSVFDADDAVQDTIIRAWEHWDELDRKTARPAWVYRIATNVCLDKLRGAKRRAFPMDLSGPAAQIVEPQETLPTEAWVWPIPDFLVSVHPEDPAEILVRKDTIRLAFVAGLQKLPPRQRAAFVMREAFGWTSEDIADLLGVTAASVNSALQRARATMARTSLEPDTVTVSGREVNRDVLERFVKAFESYDVSALAALFHEDGSLSMPPFSMWVKGREQVGAFYELTRPHCDGSRLVSVAVNGTTGFAQYAPAREGDLRPWGVHVPVIQAGRIAHVHTFIHEGLYLRLGLPEALHRG